MSTGYEITGVKQPTWKEYLEHLRRDLERAQAALDYGPQDEATLAAFEYARTKYSSCVIEASQHELHELVPDVMILDVAVTPPRPAEFIELNLVLTPDGTEFEEPIKPLEGEPVDLSYIADAQKAFEKATLLPMHGATGATGTEGCPTGPTGRTS